MITGDAQAVADSVARRLGIDEVAAQVLPEDKAAAVRRFQDGGRRVAMVGRRRQRCPGAGHRGRRHRHRRGHRRGRRVGRHRARAQRPARRRRRHHAVARLVPQDDREPRLGDGLQRRRHPGRGGPPRALGHRPADGARCRGHERLDDHRGHQRPAPASSCGSAPRRPRPRRPPRRLARPPEAVRVGPPTSTDPAHRRWRTLGR